jgi:PKD repeat protein
VSLTVTGPAGSDAETKVDYIHVAEPVPPVADFSANKTSGEKPLEVTFTDASTGSIDTWEWDFDNNGTIDSYDQSPAPWTYTVAGDYTVSLTVSGLGGSDTETKTDYIHVSEPSAAPIIDKIRGTKEPGKVIRIIGSGFDEPQGDSEVHIGPKVYGPNHTKIRLWTDTMIKVKLPNYKCAWFKGNDYRRRKIRVVVKSSPQDEGISSNVKSIKVFKPSTCP